MPESRITLRRALRDALRPTRAQAVMAVVLCLVSMATVWQVRDRAVNDVYSTMRRSDLVQVLDQLNGNAATLRTQISQQQAVVNRLKSSASNRQAAQEQARKRLAELQILAGTAPATGPGIKISIVDPEVKVTAALLLDAVEEMRDAGAEAISINGVRVVASTWFAGEPGSIQVNGQTIQAPYEITVIGEPHALEEGARFRGGLVSQAQGPTVNAVVRIVASEQLTITALAKPRTPQFAKPQR